MKEKITIIISALVLITILGSIIYFGNKEESLDTGLLSAAAALNTFQGGTGTSSPSGILYGNGTIRLQTVSTDSNLSFATSTGILSFIGSLGDVFAWTPDSGTGGNATTTLLQLQQGFISSASSSVTNLQGSNFFASSTLVVDGKTTLQDLTVSGTCTGCSASIDPFSFDASGNAASTTPIFNFQSLIASASSSASNLSLSNLFASSTIIGDGALVITGGGSLTGTWSDLGTVTTVDINGGTVDGTTIG